MNAGVNPRRTYTSNRRQEQARQTRLAILTASRHLFLERGYAATTVAAIAESADVSVETIYKSFGNKAGLVKAVFDIAVVGDDEPVPMLDRDFVRQNIAEPNPHKELAAYGAHHAATSLRAGPIQLVVRDAAASDPAAAEVWQQLQAERLTGMTAYANHLQNGDHLRPDVTIDEARDVLWTYNSVELWDLLVNHRGWTPERFGTWIGKQLAAALLSPQIEPR